MTDPKKKLRFIVCQIEFTDMRKHFEAISEEPAEYALTMPHDAFLNISAETVQNDCIAFSQLLRMKGLSYCDLTPETDWANGEAYGALKEDFVVVSFARTTWNNALRIPARFREGGAVTRKIEDMAEWLFLHGFTVQNENTHETVRYVRFSGSANMSRHGKVMFVNAAHEPELSRHVTLGLEDGGCLTWAKSLIPSKWDAYKGLCLSDGYALAWLKETCGTPGAPELSEAGVVFVKDMKWENLSVPSPCDVKPLCFDVKSAENKKETGDFVTVEPQTGDYAEKELENAKNEAILTDGVGLIAPEAAGWISAALCGDPDTVSTFQIRLPFVKGMVHAVDFPAYLAERGVTEIRDAWNNPRPVSSVWMVLPLSMFKAYKWFQQLAKLAGRNKEETPRLYHERIQKYGHDLVITQRHIPKSESGRAEPFRLNYEVLQTCGLSEEEFNALLEENLNQYAKLCKDWKTRFEWLTDGANISKTDEENDEDDEENLKTDNPLEASEDTKAASSEEDEDEEKAEEETEEATNSGDVSKILAKAVQKNHNLLDSEKAKAILTDACNTLAFRKLLRGQLTLPEGSQGESRYLSCDLGRYLDYLVSLAYPGDGAKKGNDFRRLSPGEFYAPGFRAKREYCALFRTPHYSRNEHLVLRPLREESDPARKRWFGHLRGALMIPAEGFAAARLGGADFDGDHVSVVDDKTYVGALELALGLSELNPESRDKYGGSYLPFIVIPDASKGESGQGNALYSWDENNETDENRRRFLKEEFYAFRSSCENRVGEFSNYAFTHGAVAYGANPSEDKERLVQKLVVLCGMEIDAAKTSKKPQLPKGASVKGGLFLSLAQASRSAKKMTWEGKSNKRRNEISLKETVGSFGKKANGEKSRKAATPLCLMDRIPGELLLVHDNIGKSLKKSAVKEKEFCFSDCFRFSVDGMEWDEKLLKAELLENLSLLHKAYLSVNYWLFRRRQKREPVSYDNDLTRILWPRFLETGDHVGFDEAHTLCKQFFRTLNSEQNENIRAALSEAAPVPFEQIQTREKREERLMEIFQAAGFHPEKQKGWEKLRGQLLNFDGNGFCLPYLMLNLALQKKEKKLNPYYEELKDCENGKALLEKTREIARYLCKKAFPDKEDQAVLLAAHLAKYANASRGKESSVGKESFFWMIVGEKDALSFLKENPD